MMSLVGRLEGIELPEDDDVDTVGGVLIQALGHIPVEGEEVVVDDIGLRAERVQGRRIMRVRVTPAAPTELDDHLDDLDIQRERR